MRCFPFALLVALAVIGAPPPATAVVRTLDLTVDGAATDVDVTLGVAFLGIGDQQTVNDVGFSGTVASELDLGQEPPFGLVARSLRFVSGEVVVADTTFDQLQVNFGIPIDIVVQTLGMSGSFDDDTLPTGAPSAANTVPVDLTPITLFFDMGSLEVTLTPPGDTTPFPLDEGPLVFDLDETGTVVTVGNQVTVTLPINEVASVTELDVTIDLAIVGDLVLTGTLPPSDVPAVSPLPLAAGTLLLLGVGLAAVRRRLAQATSIP